MSSKAGQAPTVTSSQVMSAGLASAGAAFVTSKFGVAGTLIGAAVTTMIITGGSAILKAYLESVTGSVRQVPGRLRDRRKAARYGEPSSPPGRPDLRDNLAGRMRAALGWFTRLPTLSRRSILVKGLLAALVAFVIGMGVVYATERVINNNLSCGLWGNCPEGRSPGIHLGGGTGASPTVSLGRAQTGGEGGGPLERQNDQNNDLRQSPGFQPPAAQRQDAPNAAAPSGGGARPQQPAQGQDPAPGAAPSPSAPQPGGQAPADGAEVPAAPPAAPGVPPADSQPLE